MPQKTKEPKPPDKKWAVLVLILKCIKDVNLSQDPFQTHLVWSPHKAWKAAHQGLDSNVVSNGIMGQECQTSTDKNIQKKLLLNTKLPVNPE